MNIRNPLKRYYFVSYHSRLGNGTTTSIGCGVYSVWRWRNPKKEMDHIFEALKLAAQAVENPDIEILSMGVI